MKPLKDITVSGRAAVAILLVALVSVLAAAHYANKFHALRGAVLAREAAIPGFLGPASALSGPDYCRGLWHARLASWIRGADVCE